MWPAISLIGGVSTIVFAWLYARERKQTSELHVSVGELEHSNDQLIAESIAREERIGGIVRKYEKALTEKRSELHRARENFEQLAKAVKDSPAAMDVLRREFEQLFVSKSKAAGSDQES